MSETKEIRLIRCPKCDNLLSEENGLSVYKCGGCGAVLRAKNESVDLDTFSESSNKEGVGQTEDRHSDKFEKMLSDGYETDRLSNISSSTRNRAENYRNNLMNREEKWESENVSIHGEKSDTKKIARDFVDSTSYDEGPSKYANPMNKRNNDTDGFDKNDYSGDDRLELLKKLEELTLQLNRNANSIDKGKEMVNRQDSYANSYQENSIGGLQYTYPNRPNSANLFDKGKETVHHRQASYASSYQDNSMVGAVQYTYPNAPHHPYSEPSSFIHRQGTSGDGFYPPQQYMSSQQRRVGPYREKPPYQHAYSSRSYNMDTIDPYHRNVTHTYDYNSRMTNLPSLRNRDPPSHMRWPSDVNSEAEVFINKPPPRVRVPYGERRCLPIAGGAPFLTCHYCFELLLLESSNFKKMKCGACSKTILFTFSNKKIDPIKVNEFKDSYVGESLNPDKEIFSADDYDKTGGEAKIEADVSRGDSDFADVATKDKGRPLPSGSSLQDYFEYSNKFHVAKVNKDEYRKQILMNQSRSPTEIDVASNEYHPTMGKSFDSGEENREGDRIKGSKSDEYAKQILMKHSKSPTDIDVPSNEYYPNRGKSFDSGEANIEGDRIKGSKSDEPFFPVIEKKSFEENKSDKNLKQEKADVAVNGHSIPDRLVKKAEKVAGPIQPGNYWYDFRAGFWGAMGGPCLGIVPPSIEEFNYPMPEDCAGGNTDVYVNGRELNQKDMKLLSSRGLPPGRDRYYIVEISGKVIDEDTGEVIKSLGKLAPTVERLHRGFGMRIPRSAR